MCIRDRITGVTKAYQYIGRASWGVVPVAVVIYAGFLIVGTFLLKYTKYGRHVFAVGGNKKAAVVSGVNVKLTEFMVYVICGFCAAFAGLLLSSRRLLYTSRAGNIDQIAAVITDMKPDERWLELFKKKGIECHYPKACPQNTV